MQARVAKTLASVVVQTIIFSVVFAGIAAGLVYVAFAALNGEWDLDDYFGLMQLAAYTDFVGGLVVFPLYFYVRTKVTGIDHILNVAAWTWVLTMWGGIAWLLIWPLVFPLSDWSLEGLWSLEALGVGIIAFSIATPFALVSSMITFTAYELSKRVRFVRKKQAKSPRLIHP